MHMPKVGSKELKNVDRLVQKYVGEILTLLEKKKDNAIFYDELPKTMSPKTRVGILKFLQEKNIVTVETQVVEESGGVKRKITRTTHGEKITHQLFQLEKEIDGAGKETNGKNNK